MSLQRVETPAERQLLSDYIQQHLEATGSPVAKQMLDSWADTVTRFVKVMPYDYQRVLEANAMLQLAAANLQSSSQQNASLKL